MRLDKATGGFLAVLTVVCGLAGCAASRSGGGYSEVPLPNEGMVKGPRSVENVTSNMERFLPRLYYVYAEALGPDTALQGTVWIRMEVERNGQFTYVGVHKSTMHNEEFEDLLVAGLLESSFDEWPQSRDPTDIIYCIPFTYDKAKKAPKSRRRRMFEEKLKRSEEQPPHTPAKEWEYYEE